MIFKLITIDLVGELLLVSTVEQFLGLWNINQLATLIKLLLCEISKNICLEFDRSTDICSLDDQQY